MILCEKYIKYLLFYSSLILIIIFIFVALRLVRTQSFSEKYRLAAHNIASSYNVWRDFHDRHGYYPNSFEELLKEDNINPQLCLDPFSPDINNNLKVIRTTDNVYIYSVGPDGIDNKLSKFIFNTDWELSGDYCLIIRDQHNQKVVPMPLIINK